MIKKNYIVSIKDYDYFDHFRRNADDGISNYESESLSKASDEFCEKEKELILLLEKMLREDHLPLK